MKKLIKIVSLFIVMILSVCVLSVHSYALETSELLGDANGDGKVNINDVTAIQRHIAKLKSLDDSSIERSKVCGYEKLSIIDATAVQSYIAKRILEFPAERATSDTVTKVKNDITIYFTNTKNWSKVNARFFNRSTGVSENTEMKFLEKDKNGDDIYTASADISKYDRVVFGDGEDETTDTPLTKASSGYYIMSGNKKYNGKLLAGIYTYGKNNSGNIDTVEMNYPDGYEKDIYIWTPEDYNPDDVNKKYSVLYMCDGQNLFNHRWFCDVSINSLMSNGGDGVIVVGITSSGQFRFNELTPNIGELTSAIPELPDNVNLLGETFSDFVVNNVIPYVENNYNTNSIRGIAGSSSGGIESFYIGMEHLDKFRYVGAMSPAFDYFEDDVWDRYLSKKDFSKKVPRIYISNGNNPDDFVEQTMYKAASAMEAKIKSYGYPAGKVTTVLDDDAAHNESFWAIYFPDMLSFGLQF